MPERRHPVPLYARRPRIQTTLSRTPACFADDEQFKEEKAVIIKEISLLQPAPPLPAQ